MTQVYSVPSQGDDPHSLPDCEVFYFSQNDADYRGAYGEDDWPMPPGWYWWSCFSGCLPDSDPIGPFDSEREAIEDAQSDSWQFEDDDETEGEPDV